MMHFSADEQAFPQMCGCPACSAETQAERDSAEALAEAVNGGGPLYTLDPGHEDSGLAGTTASNGKTIFSTSQVIDQIDSGRNWLNVNGSDTVTFSFGGSLVNAAGYDPFSAQSEAWARYAMDLFADVCGLNFVESNDPNDADITFRYIEGSTNGGGWAYYPWSGGSIVNIGYVSWEPEAKPGTHEFSIITHELGHAVGLSHPGSYNGGGFSYSGNAEYYQDSEQYSVMSYWNEANTGARFGGEVELGIHDILALQHIYGANTTTRTGDTTYGYNSTADRISFDLDNNSRAVFSIWDAGGTDTLDLSGSSSATVLDLREGSFSSVNGYTHNISIAYGATVENGVGGAHADTITGNDAANVLTGGGGSDSFTLGGGNDEVRDSLSNLNGDSIADFDAGDVIRVVGQTVASLSAAAINGSSWRLQMDQNGDGSADASMTMVGNFASYVFEVVSDGLDSLIRLAAPNNDPTDIGLSGTTVAENAATGTVVGGLSGVDPDGDALTYTLTNNAGGLFAINNGNLVVNGALDYETATSHSVTIQASDGRGGSYSESFTINVTDVADTNRNPTDIGLSGTTVAENASAGTVVGGLSGVDPDGDALTYALTNNAGGLFAINNGNLVVNGALDYETATSHSVTIQASDGRGGAYSESFTINVTDVDESVNADPTDISLSGTTVAENASAGTVVGGLSGVDPDGDALTYTLTNNAGGLFALNNGNLVVNGALDYETATSHTVTIQATDGRGGSYSENFTIGVTDVDDTNNDPTDISLSGTTVAENVAAGTVVGGLSGVDPDGDALTYTLTNNAGGLFALNNGNLVVNGALDYETATSHTVTIQATDGRGGSYSENFTIGVTDVDDTNNDPTDISLSGTTVAENVAAGTVVGGLSGVDPDGDALTYTLTNNAGGLFALNNGNLVVNGALDYETATSHTVTIQATDGRGGSYSESFTITVTNDASEDEVINGTSRRDRLNGGDGDDTINGFGGRDVINGDAGADTINGGGGADTLRGGADNDLINGENGRDRAYGGDGDDVMNGGRGSDLLRGEAGNDTINGDSGRDRAYGGEGDDAIDGGSGADILRGQAGADTIDGGTGNDKIYGGAGDDILLGGAGGDKIYGSSGDDEITGGSSNDQMWGGSGADTFFFAAGDGRRDRIFDFNDGVDLLSIAVGGFDDLTIVDTSLGARVDYGGGRVYLTGIDADQLTQDDFLFTA